MLYAADIRGEELNVHNFHGFIGCRNTILADRVEEQFATPEHFFARWLDGLAEEYKAEMHKRLGWRERFRTPVADIAIFQLVRMMRDTHLREYTRLFLEHNFYHNMQARVRPNPADPLWIF